MFMNEKQIANYIAANETIKKDLLKKSRYCKGKNVKMGLDEFIAHKDIANDHPETTFYLYTKNVDTIGPYILEHANKFPHNLIINISIWNEQNIEWFKRLQHLPFIKAFVVITGYDYSKSGIEIQTKCNAYNGKKLNKNITCYKCKKCFDKNKNHKIIGCDEH